MDIKTASALRRLRLVSGPEAISFLLLLVCSVLKRTTDFNAVPVMGAIHGFLFVVYVLFWADAWNRAKWSLGTAAFYFDNYGQMPNLELRTDYEAECKKAVMAGTWLVMDLEGPILPKK